jgi:Domain of unknown function (DUF4386)
MPMKTDSSGRIAGALYVVVIATGMFSLVYVPSQLQLTGDAATVVHSIISHEAMYRLGIVSWLINCVAFLSLPIAIYRLFHAVNPPAAILMVAFALMSIPISMVAVGSELDVLSLSGGKQPPVQAVSLASRQEMVMQSLTAYDNCMFAAQLFWGLWLVPLGLLVWQSRAVPRVLGILLLLGGVGYLIQEIGGALSSSFGQTPLSQYATLPAAAGEIGLGFWLLLRGVRQIAVDAV